MEENHENEEIAEVSSSAPVAGVPPITSPMPLSMPPFVDLTARSADTPEGAGRAPSELPTPVAGVPPITSPMPLSMPPFIDLGGGSGSPPPPPGTDWAWPPQAPTPPPPSGQRHRRPLALLAAAVVLAAGLGTGLGLSVSSSNPGGSSLAAIPSNTTEAPLSGSNSVSAIAKAVTPAVVDISTNVASSGAASAAGTGMIVTSSGEVLTNNHVIEDATSISVSIQGRTGSYGASVVGVDPVHDVALLQLKGVSNLPTVSLGDSSKVKIGDSVVALGNALGLGGSPSVTSGTISGLDRSIQASDSVSSPENLSGLLETDAQIQPGDSGGPLVNSSGQVVGMDTAAASADGSASIGFAIPINEARSIAQNIEKGKATNGIILGLSPFLGVEVEPASDAASQGGFGNFGFGFGGGLGFSNPVGNSGTATTPAGQFVESVVTSGPAERAGIVAGDTITSINGSKITNTPSSLTSALAKLKAGSTATVGIVNTSGATSSVKVTIGSIPK